MPPLGATNHFGQDFATIDMIPPTRASADHAHFSDSDRPQRPTAGAGAQSHDVNLPLRNDPSTTMAPSRSASSSSTDVVGLVRRLLRMPRPSAATQDEAHPLAVVLLLLECRLVQALTPSSQSPGTTSPRQHAIPLHLGTQDVEANDVIANTMSSAHHTSPGSTATGTTAETRTMPPRSSAPTADNGTAVEAHTRAHAPAIQHGTDHLPRPDWRQWISYMSEVYMHPVQEDETWASPLYVPPHVAPSLVMAMSETELNVRAQRLLQHSIDELEAYIITHFGFTCPSNVATASTPSTTELATITSALATARRRSLLSLANPTSDLSCRVLAVSLAHLVSSECFAVSGGGASYALSEQDDQAIRRFFSATTPVGSARPKPVAWVSDSSRPANRTSREAGEENISLAHYLSRGSSTRISPVPKMTGKKPRPMSVGSSGAESYMRSPSMMTFDSAASSPLGHMRHDSRPSDTESMLSNTPLLAARSSPVSAAPSPSRHSPSFSKIRPPPVLIEDTARGGPPLPIAPPFSSLISKPSQSYPTETDPSSPSLIVASRTNCTLSPDERRHFIRQAKKLEHLLGKPVKEAQTKEIIQAGTRNGALSVEGVHPEDRPSIRRKRSYSHPLVPMSASQAAGTGSSTRLWSLQVGGQEMKRANSSPNPSSPSSPPAPNQLLSVASPTSPAGAMFPLSPLSPTTPMSATDATTMASKSREQRRKKLAKLHRLLGEKVPVELALSKPGSVSTLELIEPPGSRRNGTGAKRIWERAKGHVQVPWHSHVRQHDEAELEQARRDEFIVDVEPDRQVFPLLTATATAEASAAVGTTTTSSTSTRAAELKDLATARKLEDRFGALPPKNLFQSAKIKLPSRMDHRNSSDSRASDTSLATSVSSIESYRTSIASLRFLMEQDPEALDQIAVALNEDEEGENGNGVEVDPAADPQEAKPLLHQHVEALRLDSDRVRFDDDSIDDESRSTLRNPDPSASSPPTSPTDSLAFPQTPPFHRTPSATMGSVRKVNKLLNFFGTLRGEVWNRLLDELQLAIEGDDEIEKEDKTALLLEVQKLRTFKPVDGRGAGVAAAAAG